MEKGGGGRGEGGSVREGQMLWPSKCSPAYAEICNNSNHKWLDCDTEK